MNLFLSVSVTDNEINNIQNDFAILTYLGGYSIHSVIKLKLKCEICKNSLTIDKELAIHEHFDLIKDSNRGGLKYATLDIVNIYCS